MVTITCCDVDWQCRETSFCSAHSESITLDDISGRVWGNRHDGKMRRLLQSITRARESNVIRETWDIKREKYVKNLRIISSLFLVGLHHGTTLITDWNSSDARYGCCKRSSSTWVVQFLLCKNKYHSVLQWPRTLLSFLPPVMSQCLKKLGQNTRYSLN